jgi:hypothetical protein
VLSSSSPFSLDDVGEIIGFFFVETSLAGLKLKASSFMRTETDPVDPGDPVRAVFAFLRASSNSI